MDARTAVTYGLTIERIVDAPAEVVFDTIVDPTLQDEIFADLVEAGLFSGSSSICASAARGRSSSALVPTDRPI